MGMIKKCSVCNKDFLPLVGNQKKCAVCRMQKKDTRPAQRVDCIVCGKTFSTPLYNKKFCSRECRERFHYLPIPQNKVCLCCGKSFTTTKGNRKYCSDYCSLQAKVGKLRYAQELTTD